MYRYSETSEVRFKYNFNHIQFKTINFSFFYLKKKGFKNADISKDSFSQGLSLEKQKHLVTLSMSTVSNLNIWEKGAQHKGIVGYRWSLKLCPSPIKIKYTSEDPSVKRQTRASQKHH